MIAAGVEVLDLCKRHAPQSSSGMWSIMHMSRLFMMKVSPFSSNTGKYSAKVKAQGPRSGAGFYLRRSESGSAMRPAGA